MCPQSEYVAWNLDSPLPWPATVSSIHIDITVWQDAAFHQMEEQRCGTTIVDNRGSVA